MICSTKLPGEATIALTDETMYREATYVEVAVRQTHTSPQWLAPAGGRFGYLMSSASSPARTQYPRTATHETRRLPCMEVCVVHVHVSCGMCYVHVHALLGGLRACVRGPRA